MPDPLHYLATWAAGLKPEDIPHDVLVRAQLQHLSAAGNLRAVHKWVFEPTQTSPAARSAAKCALIDFSDHLFWGKTTLGAVFPALENPKGRSAMETLTATVVANEVAARYGAASSLSAEAGQHAARVHSLAAAAASAKIHKLNAEQTRSAFARALNQTPSTSIPLSQTAANDRAQFVGNCIEAGLQATEWAAQNPENRAESVLSQQLLGEAFTGLGDCWLGWAPACSTARRSSAGSPATSGWRAFSATTSG